MQIFDSRLGKIRPFVPKTEGRVSIYCCGATVQGGPHLGHLRSAVAFDGVVRWLQYRGYRTTVVRNVTDVDDKILAKSAEHGEMWWARAYRYERDFQRAYDALNILQPDYEPRATGHIPEIVQLIATLIDRGHAYVAQDHSSDVYFDVRSWPEYGSLTHQEEGVAVNEPEGAKRDSRDFALWKGHKSTEPVSASWNSPWGRGRPGWHVECSAMSGKYVGTTFDIHGGGLDLRFPHHENERAQSLAAGWGSARYWMHNGLVMCQGEKMSKSLGNVVTAEEIFSLVSPRVVRYYLGQTHYRSVFDFRREALGEAAVALGRVDHFLRQAEDALAEHKQQSTVPEDFTRAMDDDVNMPKALAVLHGVVHEGNTLLEQGDAVKLVERLAAVKSMMRILGLVEENRGVEQRVVEALVQSHLHEREEARQAGDWGKADAIRQELEHLGVKIEDTPRGTRWSVEGQ